MISLDIHGWLLLKWQYQPNTSQKYIQLFKGYVNATYKALHDEMLNQTEIK